MAQRKNHQTGTGRFFAVLLAALFASLAAIPIQAASPATTQSIELPAGWSLISIQVGTGVTPEAFKDALDSPDNLIELWGYAPSGSAATPGSWQTYQPKIVGYPHDLPAVEPGKAYWVKVSQFSTVTLAGSPWDGAVSLLAGWNAVGFPGLILASAESQELVDIFGATFDRVPQVWAWDNSGAQRYTGFDTISIPEINDLTSVEPGAGYLIFALEAITLTPDAYLALPQDADASPLQEEEPFVLDDFDDLPNPLPNPTDYFVNGEPLEIRKPGPEDLPFDLNANGIIDSPFTQDTIRFEIGVDRQIISIGNLGPGIINWFLEEDAPWLMADINHGSVSSELDRIVLSVDRSGLLPGTYTDQHVTVHYGSREKLVNVILEVSTAAGDWKGLASAERVNGKDTPLGAVDLALNLFMETDAPTEKRFRAVLNSDESLLFPRDVFMNGIFFAGNDFSLTTNFEMPAGDRNAPPFDSFSHSTDLDPKANARGDKDYNGDLVLDNENPFPFPVTREITLLGQRLEPDRIEGSYVEAIGGMLPNEQVIFIEGTFFLERSTLEPTRRSIFNETLRQVTQIGGSGGLNFREQVIAVDNPVNVQGVVFTHDLDFPAPAALVITLTGPTGELITIHRNGEELPLGQLRLDEFNGSLGEGDWTLRIEWADGTGERGFLNSWGLNIEGVATYNVSGRVVDLFETAPDVFEPRPIEGARLFLSGSNVPLQATSAADGTFSFAELTENKYSLTISRQGFHSGEKSFLLSDLNLDLGDLTLAPLDINDPQLVASPAEGYEPLFVELELLIPDSDFASVGTNPTSSWDFDGPGNTDPVADTDQPDDAINLLSATHIYDTPGHFTASVTLSGDAGAPNAITRTVEIHVQRTAPDAGGSALQLVDVRFSGSFAAPLSDAGPVVQLADPQNVASYDISNDGQPPLTNIPSATVWQANKPDSAAFDIDREPHDTTSFRPIKEDSDFFTQLGTLFHDISPEPEDGIYTTYEQPQLGGSEIPDRFRAVVTMGGGVFGTKPSRVGAFKLQPGRPQRTIPSQP